MDLKVIRNRASQVAPPGKKYEGMKIYVKYFRKQKFGLWPIHKTRWLVVVVLPVYYCKFSMIRVNVTS